MNRHWTVAALIMLLLLPSCTSDRDHAASDASPQVLDWPGVGKGFLEWGQSPEGFFATSRSDGKDVLEAWTWQGATPKKEAVNVPRSLDVTVLPAGKYLACVAPPPGERGPWPLKLMSFASPEAIRTWENPRGWDYSHAGASTNGRFVALILGEDLVRPPPDRDWKNPRHRVGILDTSTWDLRWVAELRGHGDTIRQIAVSNDGTYVAVAGWANGVAMVDASQEKVLWIDRPPTEVSTGYAVFSADGLTLYTAGSEGCVYTIDTKTGNITGQRWRVWR